MRQDHTRTAKHRSGSFPQVPLRSSSAKYPFGSPSSTTIVVNRFRNVYHYRRPAKTPWTQVPYGDPEHLRIMNNYFIYETCTTTAAAVYHYFHYDHPENVYFHLHRIELVPLRNARFKGIT